MPGGFTSPAILFLSTWEAPERVFAIPLLEKLRKSGYSRYVEPAVGSYALALVARAAGYQPSEIDTSDAALFPSILGSALSGRSLELLDLRVDGELVDVSGEPLDAAANLMIMQLELRLECRPDVPYWVELLRDISDRRDEHVQAVRDKIEGLAERLGGCSYEPLDMFTHLDRVADDPKVVANMNPPTYKGAYEKFFDTGGRLTWREPEYEVFDQEIHWPRMLEQYRDAKMLLMGQMQRPTGDCLWPEPFYARPQGAGVRENTYYVANRPDEVLKLIGSRVVVPRKLPVPEPLPYPIFGYKDEVTAKSVIETFPISVAQARYYKRFWMHRGIGLADGSLNFAMLIDGKVAGVGGYSTAPIVTPYGDTARDALLLRFATGAPNENHRLTRLIAKMAMQWHVVEPVLLSEKSGHYAIGCAKRLITAEFTRYPEQKNQRGLMKLVARKKNGDQYHLTYQAPIDSLTPEQVLAFWIKKEKTWRKNRKTSSS